MKSTGNAMRLIPHPKKSIFLIKLGGYVRFCFFCFFLLALLCQYHNSNGVSGKKRQHTM